MDMNIIKNAYAKAEAILIENMDKLHFVAEYLIKNETMDAEQFECAMQPDATVEKLDEIKNSKLERSQTENNIRKEEIERAEQEKMAQDKHDEAKPSDSPDVNSNI